MTNTVHIPIIEHLAQQIIKASSKAEQIAISRRCPLQDLPALRARVKQLLNPAAKKPLRNTRLPACYVLTKQRLTKITRTKQHGT
ncbi:hypothetical protein PNIG_a2012 [Pseudoalteromonas nigrifaciens]|jgi:hypothetical protein|uniref:Uncharacterized protein n=1 Tax=Pseudoalteromonas nigrifaciens TaxID=28109 RepID=A0AAC9XXT6_9GAMM|nr:MULTISPECIES: hypothetical protein [Pseudoalteromonas]ASM54079.1 hypothetical protein PNIG_a2012 [Pseudoalteromonas nigrifaciens]MBB1404879.1 hypothetical protein [Pseudoalteromonas sp. SG44-5]GEN42607.1 hypothetical protein PNI02_20730 [Pseudoalteromonas nigrifaciens]SUC52090.1 Uncharacterised protein [Pseudoalteromonas nigrifaciens]|tara:strand:- start:7591 stop:7845 length:255 start_codon:yes stop_codon:yes gene_type:complete